MAALIDGLGVVAGSLGIIGFFLANIPDAPPAQGANIKIKAGLPGDDNPGLDGDIAAAYAYDIDNNYLGKSDGSHVDTGGVVDLTIDSSSPGTRAEYVGVAVGTDAVCVAWITVNMFDATTGGSWTGDVGYSCGQHWFMQHEKAGYLDDDQTQDYIPYCTWLDEDHTGDVPSAAMKFSSSAYGEKVTDTKDNAKGCDFTLWGPDNGPINGKPEKRAAHRPRHAWMEERLIVSNLTQHRAEELCSSETSWGPDFVGTDGQFCDMGTKTLTPLCSTENVEGCIDIDHNSNVVNKRSFVAKREVSMPHKSYSNIKRWDHAI